MIDQPENEIEPGAQGRLSDSETTPDRTDVEDRRLDELIEEVRRLREEVARSSADGEQDDPAPERGTT